MGNTCNKTCISNQQPEQVQEITSDNGAKEQKKVNYNLIKRQKNPEDEEKDKQTNVLQDETAVNHNQSKFEMENYNSPLDNEQKDVSPSISRDEQEPSNINVQISVGQKTVNNDDTPLKEDTNNSPGNKQETQTNDYPSQTDTQVRQFGPIKLDNGAIYQGQWCMGQKNGYGVQNWPDGSRYEGNWQQGQSNGQGQLFHADGDLYDGDWENDQANGYGVYTHQNGAQYEGDWKNDKQCGYGVENWPDGSQYEGYYFDGKQNGRGKLFFTDGSTYDGDFKLNEIEGYGTYSWPDKRVYQGNWVNNQMQGQGQIIWPDGQSYSGQYKDDFKHGNGVFTWPDGRQYIGSWVKGQQHGYAIYIQQEEKRIGEWKDGARVRWVLEEDEINKLKVQGQIPKEV